MRKYPLRQVVHEQIFVSILTVVLTVIVIAVWTRSDNAGVQWGATLAAVVIAGYIHMEYAELAAGDVLNRQNERIEKLTIRVEILERELPNQPAIDYHKLMEQTDAGH